MEHEEKEERGILLRDRTPVRTEKYVYNSVRV